MACLLDYTNKIGTGAINTIAMKKVLLGFSIFLLVISGFTSCKKIIDKLFTGIDVKVPDVVLAVPVVPIVLPVEMSLGTVTMKFNLDSLIRANTAGIFNVNDINSVKVKQYTITLPDGDQNNNLSNFQSARVSLSSNSNNEKIDVATVDLPDVASNTITFTPANTPELISYLKGSELYFTVYGRARKTTSKPLTLVASATVRVE